MTPPVPPPGPALPSAAAAAGPDGLNRQATAAAATASVADAAIAAPVVRRSWLNLSLIWLVPAVAALVAFAMLYRTWQASGPRIDIQFQTAAGLEAGKTAVRFKNVVIGTVKRIVLTPDRNNVVVTVALTSDAQDFAREDARFWVVRPRVGSTGVSGIDTLLSGAYIAADIGRSTVARTGFVGLETPPLVITGSAGTRFRLQAEELGSLDVGSPVYHRGVQVGQVASYGLGSDGRAVTLQVFINAPHDKLVGRGARFWNASGVNFALGADGVRFDAQSLATVVAGGIAFATPFNADATPAAADTAFLLERDRQSALAPPDGQALYVQMRFARPVRGLVVDSPVEFQGLRVGRVMTVDFDPDAKGTGFGLTVGALLYPQRLARLRERLVGGEGEEDERNARFIARLVERGLRASVRTGNLVTQQRVVSLDIVPGVPVVRVDTARRPLELPTVPGTLEEVQEQVASILRKVDGLPLASIGRRTDEGLARLSGALERLNTGVLPEAEGAMRDSRAVLGEARGAIAQARGSIERLQATLEAARSSSLAEDSPLQLNLAQTLLEVQRAAQSVRTVTDLLGRHPESLLRGLPRDPPLPAVPPLERQP